MEPGKRSSILLSLESYAPLAAELAALLDVEQGQLESSRFPDGERYLRVHDVVANKNIILLGGTHDDGAFLDVYDIGCHLVRSGARSLAMVVPYYGYSTMERATQAGEVVTAKTRARALASIPPAQTGNVIFLMDLHTDGIAHYFGDGIVSRHLSAMDVVCDLVRSLQLTDPIIASTDAGRAKQVAKIANALGYEAAFVYKRRVQDALAVTGVNADVSGRPVVIYDDMVRTGGSLVQAAEAYLAQGAAEVHAVTTHLVLARDAASTLVGSGSLASLSGTNTHPRSQLLSDAGGRVATVAPVLADALLSRYPYLSR